MIIANMGHICKNGEKHGQLIATHSFTSSRLKGCPPNKEPGYHIWAAEFFPQALAFSHYAH